MFFGMRIRTLIGRRDWREDMSAYMDGELSARDRARVEAQLAESAEMREYLSDLEEMRSVLRAFEPAPGASPFQLTTEMLDDPARVALRPTAASRALRLSMSTAAIGVATFAAVMVFDAVDTPTVTFTTTSAGITADGVPTASVVTDEIEVESQSQQAVASDASQPPSRSNAAASAQEQEADESATVASVELDEEQQQVAQEAAWQAQQEAQEASEYEDAEELVEQEAEPVSKDAAADDPSRRAITAGRAGSDAEADDAETITAEDVVQQQEVAEEQATAEQAEPSQPESTSANDGDSEPSQASSAATSTEERNEEQSQAVSQAQTERRTVATSVRHSQSDWPLEQRPRSSTVELARDPSWEGPVQIVLAVVAIGATLVWLGLTIVDRRRRT